MSQHGTHASPWYCCAIRHPTNKNTHIRALSHRDTAEQSLRSVYQPHTEHPLIMCANRQVCTCTEHAVGSTQCLWLCYHHSQYISKGRACDCNASPRPEAGPKTVQGSTQRPSMQLQRKSTTQSMPPKRFKAQHKLLRPHWCDPTPA